jgi:hypothetical protein
MTLSLEFLKGVTKTHRSKNITSMNSQKMYLVCYCYSDISLFSRTGWDVYLYFCNNLLEQFMNQRPKKEGRHVERFLYHRSNVELRMDECQLRDETPYDIHGGAEQKIISLTGQKLCLWDVRLLLWWILYNELKSGTQSLSQHSNGNWIM